MELEVSWEVCPCVTPPAFEGVAESISMAEPLLTTGPFWSGMPLLPFVAITGVVVPFVCGSDLSFVGLEKPASGAAVSVGSRNVGGRVLSEIFLA